MNVVLMHGKNTDPSQKWYPWLASEMSARHVPYHAPTLPNTDEPFIDEWKSALNDSHPGQDTILIGHSRGGVAILRWLEDQPESSKVKRVILIAANSGLSKNRTIPDETNHGFYTDRGYDFAKIRSHCEEFFVLHSKDDQWVPYAHGIENSESLHAELLTFEDRGHFGKGVNEIPELLKLIS